MRVVCDNCGATYRIPDHKLVREVNKATCRKCGHGIIIRKAGASGGGPTLAPAKSISPDDATQIASAAEIEARARSGSGRGGPTPSGFGPAVGGETYPPPGEPAWSTEEPGAETVVSKQDTAQADGEATAPWMGGPPGLDAGVPTAEPEPGLPSFGRGSLPVVGPSGPGPSSQPPRLPPPPPAAPQGRPQVQRARVHDPSADMAVVLGGVFVALIALFVLITSSDVGMVAMALFAALAGLLTCLFMLATSSRGREEGKPVVSIALALLLSAGVTAFFHSSGATERRVAAVPAAVPAPAGAATASSKPPEVLPIAGEPVEGAEPVADAEEPEPEPEGDALADAEPAAEPEPAKAEPAPAKAEPAPVKSEPRSSNSTSSGSKSSSSSSARSGGSSSKSSGSSSKKSTSSSSKSSGSSKKSTSSSSKSSGSSKKSTSTSSKSSGSSKKSSSSGSSSSQPTAKGVPLTVLDTMVKNNRRVKSCFAVYKEKTGSLPSGRIPVKIAIEPNGTPYKVWINGGAYAGTTLDKCLASAIKTIAFPPFSGDAQTYNYLFVF